MKRNLELSRGVVFSGRVLLELAEAGMTREDAYAAVQAAAMRVHAGGDDFATEIARESAVTSHLDSEKLADLMNPENYLLHIPEIYKRCGLNITRPVKKKRAKSKK